MAVDLAEIEPKPKPLFGPSCRVDAFALKACIELAAKGVTCSMCLIVVNHRC